MHSNSFITLKRDAVQNNIKFLRAKLGDKVKISSVVKANAYGHGIEQIVPLFEEAGITHFSVFDYDEAVKVKRSLQNTAEIVIMGWIDDKKLKNAIKNDLEFFVFNLKRLKLALKFSKELGIKAKIHLEVETGMNRTGLRQDELAEAIEILKNNSNDFEIKGFCTHLAGAESISNFMRIKSQIKRYRNLLKILDSHNIQVKYRHIANSAATFAFPRMRLDLVRIGILQYGFWPSQETFIQYIRNKKDTSDPLKRILGWESKIMSIKQVKTGEFVGYGTSYLCQSDIITALIPIGYSSGYTRSLSNKGRVLINGHRCGIIGLVNMNMIIADISHVPDAKIGDQVVLIGSQEELEIKVSAFSDISDQLNYEVLAHLPKDITRKVI